MEIGLPVTTKTIFAEATVAEDGSLHLEGLIPNLKPGNKVLLAISPISEALSKDAKPLAGTVTRYIDPFGPAELPEAWEALREC